jgi:hypothetical protein
MISVLEHRDTCLNVARQPSISIGRFGGPPMMGSMG